jgi:hypothetical protein
MVRIKNKQSVTYTILLKIFLEKTENKISPFSLNEINLSLKIIKQSCKISYFSNTTFCSCNGFETLLKLFENKELDIENRHLILDTFEINLSFSDILNYILIKNSNFIVSLANVNDDTKLSEKIKQILNSLVERKEGKYLKEIIIENIGVKYFN